MAKKDTLPLHLSKWNIEGGRKREKKAKKKEGEFWYGIEKEMVDKEKSGF